MRQRRFAEQITPRIEGYVRTVWRGHPELEDLLQVARITTDSTITRKLTEPGFDASTLYAAVKARVRGALINYFRDSGHVRNALPYEDNIVKNVVSFPRYAHQEPRSKPITVHFTARQREGIQLVASRYGYGLNDVVRASVELLLAAAASANPPQAMDDIEVSE